MNIEQLLTKRFQTTMIGALFEFEKYFGHLWGQNKYEDEALTQSEEKYRQVWDDVRNRILNNGNSQLRKCLSDIKPGQVQYHYKFYKKGQE